MLGFFNARGIFEILFLNRVHHTYSLANDQVQDGERVGTIIAKLAVRLWRRVGYTGKDD